MNTREIKFRAWDNQQKIMRDDWHTFGTENGLLEIMQFTGLLDRHGKEIYEGDVIRVYRTEEMPDKDDIPEGETIQELLDDAHVCDQVVKWTNDGGYFCDEDTGDFCHPLGEQDELTLEIIGNVYENPSLLTNTK